MSSLGYSRTKTAQRGWGNPALSMNATGQQGCQAGPDLREGSWGETLGLKKNWGGCCLELGSVGEGGWKPWRFMSVLSEFNLIRNRMLCCSPSAPTKHSRHTQCLSVPRLSGSLPPKLRHCEHSSSGLGLPSAPHTGVGASLGLPHGPLYNSGEAAGPVSEAVQWKTGCSGTFCSSP